MCNLYLFFYVLQNVVPAEVSLVCVVKPDEFWDKKVTHFCFWKEKDRLGFEVKIINIIYHKYNLYENSCVASLKVEFADITVHDLLVT